MPFTKNIIVTGSSGQIGQAFVRHLSQSNDGYYIYALDKKNLNIIKKIFKI